jgi:hypothetical protein
MAKNQPVSSLLLDEQFSSQDPQFVPTLRRVTDDKLLLRYVEKWKSDPRPWAREQVLAFLNGPLDSQADRVIVKRLFKHFESLRDDELMAAFLVAFDRFVRRRRKVRHHYDYQSRTSWQTESLRAKAYDRRFFSHHTRYSLRRRAWRYFRRMGVQQPQKYCAAIAAALRLYEDEAFAKGENILDSWGLMHALFGKHDALDIGASHVNLKPGRDLGELSPAPWFLPLWQEPQAVPILLTLVEQARSRLVRVSAIGLLRRQHGRRLAGVTVDHVIRLLDHADEEVQQFGAELLQGLGNLPSLPIETWLQLLATKNLTALETIAQLMRQHVPADRMSLETAVTLAIARPAPVARLGLEFLRPKPIATPADAALLAQLAAAKSSAVAGELATLALARLGEDRFYDVDLIIAFFDSLQREARDGAWMWLLPKSEISNLKSEISNSARAYNDPALWSRLLESPFDDCRLKLVEALGVRAAPPGQGADRLTPLWCAVLLNVHRGGRHKPLALRQISDALGEDPARAETLLPVLAVALRSVRAPEARAGLAALVRAADRRPDILPLIGRYLPEVQLIGEVEACS